MRFLHGIVVAYLLAFPTGAIAQTANGEFMEVLPHHSDAFTLTPVAPVATRPIVFGAVRGADIMVSSPSQELEVRLISPRRAHYTIGQSRQDFQSTISRHDGLGA